MFIFSSYVSIFILCFYFHPIFLFSSYVSIFILFFYFHPMFLFSSYFSIFIICFYFHSMFLFSAFITIFQTLLLIYFVSMPTLVSDQFMQMLQQAEAQAKFISRKITLELVREAI